MSLFGVHGNRPPSGSPLAKPAAASTPTTAATLPSSPPAPTVTLSEQEEKFLRENAPLINRESYIKIKTAELYGEPVEDPFAGLSAIERRVLESMARCGRPLDKKKFALDYRVQKMAEDFERQRKP